MPIRKSKKKRVPQNFTTKMLRDINATKLSGTELMGFANEVQRLKPEDRVFEGRVVVAIRLFNDSNKAMSAMFRMEALARIISQGLLRDGQNPRMRRGCL